MKNYSLVMLMLLVLLQSLFGLADAHQYHQSGSEHLSFNSVEHDHEAHFDTEAENEDCHHCCHCHNATSSAMVSDIQNIELKQLKYHLQSYQSNAPPRPLKDFYRPPIA